MINDLVKQVLEQNERSRSSDKELILAVWERQGLYLDEAQRSKFFQVAPAETIRRIRQKIQESGELLAGDKVRKERRFKAQRMQQIAPKAGPKFVEQVLF